MSSLTRLDTKTKTQISRSYATRRVPLNTMNWISNGIAPQAGDLLLARITKIGYHKNLQGHDRVRKKLFVGDLVALAYANRYASNQYAALVPDHLQECHLIAGGGCAGVVQSQHARMRAATKIEPVGLLCADQNGVPLNLANFALTPRPIKQRTIRVVAVVGTAMDSGKTTTAAHLIHGATALGFRMGYAKITGTGASGDPGFVADAGAVSVLDFTDAGYASTFKVSAAECECILSDLVAESQNRKVDALVVEVADGVLQTETANLLRSPVFQTQVDGVILAAGDAMGASCGASWLAQAGITLFGLAGALEASPLQLREASCATGLATFTREQLESHALLEKLFAPKAAGSQNIHPTATNSLCRTTSIDSYPRAAAQR